MEQIDIADCFEAFDAQLQAKATAYQNLSDEDKEVFTKQIKYEDDPQKVNQAFEHYTQSFCNEVAGRFQYTQQQLKDSLLKVREIRQRAKMDAPTDRITARIYVFNHLLTYEEKASVLQDNYLKDPEKAHQAMEKAGKLIAIEYAKLGLIEDTDTAKEQTAREYKEKKIKEFQLTYKPH